MKVVWSDRALRSLAAIHAHIAVDSETNAHRVIDRILKRVISSRRSHFRAVFFLIHAVQIFTN